MKKIVGIITAISLVLMLAACNGSKPQTITNISDPVTSESIMTEAPTEATNVNIAQEEPDYDFSFLIELDWPAKLNDYQPDVKVFPLISSAMIYKTGLTGQCIFIDEDLNPIPLPFETRVIGYIQNESVKGYVLYGGANYEDQALMLVDGTVPLDADGQYIKPVDLGEDGHWYPTIGSFIVIRSPETDADMSGWLYGLYDLETQSLIMPIEYDSLVLFEERLIIAGKGDTELIYDEKGQELYYFDDPVEFGMWNYYGWYGNVNYFLSATQRLFYRVAEFPEEIDNLERWNEYFIAFNYGDRNHELVIIDPNGWELHRFRYEGYFHMSDEFLVYNDGEEYIVIDRNLDVFSFFAPQIEYLFDILDFDGEELIYRVGGYQTNPEQKYFATDEKGNTRELTCEQAGQLPILYRYPSHYIFMSPDQEIVAETDGYFSVCGDFVILKEWQNNENGYSMRADPKTVLTLQGELLLDNIYGCIDEAPGPGGRLIVYLDENNCVLLSPDGSTTPVEAALTVTKTYWGG